VSSASASIGAKTSGPMSETDYFTGRRYEIIAFAYGEKPVYYEEFGREDANGVWLLVSRGAAGFSVYRGEFGYCSHPGCSSNDTFDVAFGSISRSGSFLSGPGILHLPSDLKVSRRAAQSFVGKGRYHPLLTIPVDTMKILCEQRTLGETLPVNIRDGHQWDERPSPERAAAGIITAVKIEMLWPLAVDDVVGVDNQELRSRALDRFGRERFIASAGAEIVNRDGVNELLRVHDMVFVHVRDASTPRRYLLRVPPRMGTVREAIAWTFGFDSPDDYNPVQET